MSEATNVLLELIQKASDGVDSAVAFSQAQIPDVVNQLLLWNTISSAILCIIGLAFIVVPIFIIRWLTAELNSEKEWCYVRRTGLPSFQWEFMMLGNAIIIIVGIIMVISNFDWLKIWIAPKLYLLEYAASLIKG